MRRWQNEVEIHDPRLFLGVTIKLLGSYLHPPHASAVVQEGPGLPHLLDIVNIPNVNTMVAIYTGHLKNTR